MITHIDKVARLLPDETFPPYSYVPHKFPHPKEDPRGHSYGEPESDLPAINPEPWQDCREYLRGIDLFNHGFYWEAHESWEQLWKGVGKAGPVGEFLLGLIALAAAGVKAREGNAAGVNNHGQRAREIFEKRLKLAGSGDDRFMGLDLAPMIDEASKLAENPQEFLNSSNDPVVIVFPFKLLPSTGE